MERHVEQKLLSSVHILILVFAFLLSFLFSLGICILKDNNLHSNTMKFSTAIILSLAIAGGVEAFSPNSGSASTPRTVVRSAVDEAVSKESKGASDTKDPLLIRAAKGEKVERTPVWMMRQAGRHIQEYRDLCKKYPTFRQRSEIPEVAVEVSLQPWRNYKTDGCILFSDILTPLPGVGCEFTIDEKLGPIMDPIKNWDDIKKVRIG